MHYREGRYNKFISDEDLPGRAVKGAEDNESDMEEVVIAGVKIGGKFGGIGGGTSGTGGCSNSTGASGLESPGLYGSSAK